MKIVIIGKGPAGISAAVYAKRAGADVTIIARDYGALAHAIAVDNYYGFTSVSGVTLAKLGEEQALSLGITIINEEVVSLDYEDSLVVVTRGNRYPCDKLIMATGTRRAVPPINKLADYEGKGVSYCARCDAYFMRGKHVAVIGSGEYALHEAEELLPHAASVTVLTNNKTATVDFQSTLSVVTSQISGLIGDEHLTGILFKDGSTLAVEGLFIAMHSAGSVDFLKPLGINSDRYINVNRDTMMTEIDGIYAVGDCTGGQLQIAQAVYQGMLAAIDATR